MKIVYLFDLVISYIGTAIPLAGSIAFSIAKYVFWKFYWYLLGFLIESPSITHGVISWIGRWAAIEYTFKWIDDMLPGAFDIPFLRDHKETLKGVGQRNLLILAGFVPWALSPLVTWVADRNLLLQPSRNYIKTQILKTIKEVYERFATMGRGLWTGSCPDNNRAIMGTLFLMECICASIRDNPKYTMTTYAYRLAGAFYLFSVDTYSGPYIQSKLKEAAHKLPSPLESLERTSFGQAIQRFTFPICLLQAIISRLINNKLYPWDPSMTPGVDCNVVKAKRWASHWTIRGPILAMNIIGYYINKTRKIRADEEAAASDPARPFGHPVWASRRAAFGSANHQILLVHDRKYELHLTRNAKAAPIYESNPLKIDHKSRLRAFDNTWTDPTLGQHYVYLIGWTQMTHEEIDQLCKNLARNWVYTPTTNNCQHFIRKVADEIVARKAADWGFFKTGTKTAYQWKILKSSYTILPLAWGVQYLLEHNVYAASEPTPDQKKCPALTDEQAKAYDAYGRDWRLIYAALLACALQGFFLLISKGTTPPPSARPQLQHGGTPRPSHSTASPPAAIPPLLQVLGTAHKNGSTVRTRKRASSSPTHI